MATHPSRDQLSEARSVTVFAMEAFRRILDAVSHETFVSSPNSRSEAALEAGRLIMAASDDNIQRFTDNIFSLIQGCFSASQTSRSGSSRRDAAFKAFIAARFTSLSRCWGELYGALGIPMNDQYLSQSVNQRIFHELLVESFSSEGSKLKRLWDCHTRK